MKNELTQLKRLQAAARKEPVDRPPCICPGGMMNMIFKELMEQAGFLWPDAHFDAHMMAELTYALNTAGGFENYGVPFCMTIEAEAMGAKVNMGSMLSEPRVVEAVLESCTQLEKLQAMDFTAGRTKTVLEAISLLRNKETDVPIVGNLAGPVSVGGTLLDMSILLREFHKVPESVHRYMEFITENLIAFGKAQIAAGADAICISEPSGTVEILGPRYFAEFTVHYLNEILDALTVPVKIVHVCGDLKGAYEIISQIRCDVFSFDAVVSIPKIKKHLTGQTVMGNVNTFALQTMSSEKITGLTHAALKREVDIVAPACGLPTTTPLPNVQAMVQAVRTYKQGSQSS